MNPYNEVRVILTRFNARRYDGKIARQELSRVLDYTEGNQKLKLLNLIRKFRRPGFDTPQFKAALLKPKSESFERSGPTSSDEVIQTDFKNTGGVICRIPPTFDPVEKAAELLKPQEEQIEQIVTAADVIYLSWLDDAINEIKALPKGNVFVANQFLPKEATPEEARVFGKKLLQLITKHKLYASKRKGKSCMEYVKA